MPAQSPTLSPTLSAITAGLRGSSSGFGFDLADEVCADVGGLRVDAAAEPREDGDQRASEGKTDEVPGCGGLALVEPLGRGFRSSQPGRKADDKEPGHRAGREGDAQRRRHTALRGLRGAAARRRHSSR